MFIIRLENTSDKIQYGSKVYYVKISLLEHIFTMKLQKKFGNSEDCSNGTYLQKKLRNLSLILQDLHSLFPIPFSADGENTFRKNANSGEGIINFCLP